MMRLRRVPGSTNSAERYRADQLAVARKHRPDFVPRLRDRQFRHSCPRCFPALCGGGPPGATRLRRTARKPCRARDVVDGIEWRVSRDARPHGGACLHGGARRGHPRRGRARSASGWSSIRHCSRPAPAPTRRALQSVGLPVYEAGRGGRYTYHGPGQRVGYLMLDLEKRGKDIRRFVHASKAG